MAIADIVPKIFRATFESRLRQTGKWRPLVRDESGELAAYGDTVKIPLSDDDISIVDYVVGTAGTDVANSTTNVDLAVTTRKAFFTTFELIQESETRPSLIAEKAVDAAEKFAKQHDSAILTAAKDALGAAQKVADVSIDADHATNGPASDHHAEAVFEQMLEASYLADKLLWPDDQRYVVMSPGAKRMLLKYITDKGIHYQSMVQDNILQRYTVEGPLSSFFWVMDPQMEDEFTPGNLDTTSKRNTVNGKDPVQMVFGIRGRGLHFAQSLFNMKNQDVQSRFATRLMGLSVFGAKRSRGEMIITARTQYT